MREYVLSFVCSGGQYEREVKTRDDDSACAFIGRRYPGCRIVSVLHPTIGAGSGWAAAPDARGPHGDT